jgi:hypothetical protein
MVFDLDTELLVVEEFREPTCQYCDGLGSVPFGHAHDLRLSDRD